MSGGGSQTSTVTQGVPQWVEDAGRDTYNRAKTVTDRPAYGGQRVADFSPDQNIAMQWARDTGRDGYTAMGRGEGILTGMAGYQPRMVTSPQVDGIERASAATLDRGAVRDVNAERVAAERIGAERVAAERIGAERIGADRVRTGTFTGANVDQYMNPYEDRVIAQTQADMARQRTIDRQGNEDAALRAKAFGGSRHGVVDAEYDRNYADRMGATVGNMRRQGFMDAAGIFSSDAARRLSADQGNQGATLQARMSNQETGLRANLANQETGLRAGMANQDASLRADLANQETGLRAGLANQDAGLRAQMANQGMDWNVGNLNTGNQQQVNLTNAAAENQRRQTNADMTMRGELANQSADIQGANVRRGVAGDLTTTGQAIQGFNRNAVDTMLRTGGMQQGLRQGILDADYQAFLEPERRINWQTGILSGTPYERTSTQTAPGQPAWMSAMGLGLSGAGAAGMLGWRPFG